MKLEQLTDADLRKLGLIRADFGSGIATDGANDIPKEGTWLLDKGERVISAKPNSDIAKLLNTDPLVLGR